MKAEDTINLTQLFVALALVVLWIGTAKAGPTIIYGSGITCVNDKWDAKAPEKGTRWSITLVDA